MVSITIGMDGVCRGRIREYSVATSRLVRLAGAIAVVMALSVHPASASSLFCGFSAGPGALEGGSVSTATEGGIELPPGHATCTAPAGGLDWLLIPEGLALAEDGALPRFTVPTVAPVAGPESVPVAAPSAPRSSKNPALAYVDGLSPIVLGASGATLLLGTVGLVLGVQRRRRRLALEAAFDAEMASEAAVETPVPTKSAPTVSSAPAESSPLEFEAAVVADDLSVELARDGAQALVEPADIHVASIRPTADLEIADELDQALARLEASDSSPENDLDFTPAVGSALEPVGVESIVSPRQADTAADEEGPHQELTQTAVASDEAIEADPVGEITVDTSAIAIVTAADAALETAAEDQKEMGVGGDDVDASHVVAPTPSDAVEALVDTSGPAVEEAVAVEEAEVDQVDTNSNPLSAHAGGTEDASEPVASEVGDAIEDQANVLADVSDLLEPWAAVPSHDEADSANNLW